MEDVTSKTFTKENMGQEIARKFFGIKSDDYVSLLKIFKEVKKEWEGIAPKGAKKIAIVGPVNSGKSTLFNLLVGKDLAETSPMPGTTQENAYEGVGPFVLCDTPGASESIGIEREKLALEAAQDSDFLIILFDNTFRRDGQELYLKLQQYNKPHVVAINKMDLWKVDAERTRFLRMVAESLGLEVEEIIPISAKKDMGINLLMQRIIVLEPDLMISVARHIPKYQRFIAHQFISGAAASAAIIGASPIPIADIFPLSALQAGLILKVSKIYGYDINLKRARELLPMFAGGFGLREVARQLVKLIPGYGWAISAGIAAAGTYALGAVAAEFFNTEQQLSKKETKNLFKNYFKKVKSSIFDRIKAVSQKKGTPLEEREKLLEAEFGKIQGEYSATNDTDIH